MDSIHDARFPLATMIWNFLYLLVPWLFDVTTSTVSLLATLLLGNEPSDVVKFFITTAESLIKFFRTTYEFLSKLYNRVHNLPWDKHGGLLIVIVLVGFYAICVMCFFWMYEWLPYLRGTWWAVKGWKKYTTYPCKQFLERAKDRHIDEIEPTKRLAYCKGETNGVNLVHSLEDRWNAMKIPVMVISVLLVLLAGFIIRNRFRTSSSQQETPGSTPVSDEGGDLALDRPEAPLPSPCPPPNSPFSKPANPPCPPIPFSPTRQLTSPDKTSGHSPAPNKGRGTSSPPLAQELASLRKKLQETEDLARVRDNEEASRLSKELRRANATIAERNTDVSRKDVIIDKLRERVKGLTQEQDRQEASETRKSDDVKFLEKKNAAKIAAIEKATLERILALKQHHRERCEELRFVNSRVVRRQSKVNYFKLIEDPELLDAALREEHAEALRAAALHLKNSNYWFDQHTQVWEQNQALQKQLSKAYQENPDANMFKAKIADLEKAHHAEMESLKKALRKAKRTSKGIDSAPASASTELQGPLDELRTQNQELTAQTQKLSAQIQELSQDLAHSRESQKSTQSVLAVTQHDLTAAKQTIAKKTKDTVTSMNASSTLKATIKTVSVKLASTTTAKDELASKHIVLELAHQKLVAIHGECVSKTTADQEKEQLRNQLAEVQAANTNLHERIAQHDASTKTASLSKEDEIKVTEWKRQAEACIAVQGELNNSKEEVARLTNEIEGMKPKLLSKEQQDQIRLWKARALQLPAAKEELAKAQSEAMTMKQEIEALKASIPTEDLAKAQSEAMAMKQQVEAMKSSVLTEEQKEEIAGWKEQATRLTTTQRQLNDALRNVLSLQQKVQNLTIPTTSRILSEAELKQVAAIQQQAETVPALQEAIKNAQTEINQLKQNLMAQTHQITALTNSQNLWKVQAEGFQQQRDAHFQTVTVSRGEIDKLKEEKARLQQEKEQTETYLANSRINYGTVEDALTGARKDLELYADVHDEDMQDMANLREKYDNMKIESSRWERRAAALETERDEEAARHVNDVNVIAAERDNLRRLVGVVEQAGGIGAVNGLMAQIEGLKMQNSALLLEGKKVLDAGIALEKKQEGSEPMDTKVQDPENHQGPSEEISGLVAKCKDLEGDIVKLTLDVSLAQDEVDTLKEDNANITHERAEIGEQVGVLKEGNATFNMNLQNVMIALKDLEQERDQLRSQISRSEIDSVNINQAVTNLETERSTLQQTVTGLNEQIATLQSEKATLQQRLDKACNEGRQVLRERDIEIKHRTTVLEPWGKELQAEIVQLRGAPENLGRLRQEVDQLTSVKAGLEKDMDTISKAAPGHAERENAIAEKEKALRLAKNQADITRQKLEQAAGYHQKNAKEAEQVAATLRQENTELHKELDDMRRTGKSATPEVNSGPKFPRLTDQINLLKAQTAQLKAENEALKTKIQKLEQTTSKDEDGDEGMDDAAGTGGKRPIDDQQRRKLAPKTRAFKKDLVSRRLDELEELIKKWKAQQDVKRDLSKDPSLRNKPIVDEADLYRLKNIIDTVGQELQLAMMDAGRRDARRLGWQKCSRWLAMHLGVITDHPAVKGLLVDVESIEGIVGFDDRDLGMLASNMRSMNVVEEDGEGDEERMSDD